MSMIKTMKPKPPMPKTEEIEIETLDNMTSIGVIVKQEYLIKPFSENINQDYPQKV